MLQLCCSVVALASEGERRWSGGLASVCVSGGGVLLEGRGVVVLVSECVCVCGGGGLE